MRILFVTPQTYPPQSAGGSLSSTHDLCVGLAARGHDVAVLCGLDSRGFLGTVTRLRRKLATVNRFPVDRVMGYPTYRGWDVPAGVPEVIRRFKPDAAIAQAGQTIAVADVLVEHGLPTIAYIRDVEFDKMGKVPFSHPLISYVANSRFTAEQFGSVFGLDSEVIPPLVDQGRFQTNPKRRVVLHINPFPQKGIDITLELARRRQDIPFEIIESWTVNRDVTSRFGSIANALPNVTWRKSVGDMRKVYRNARIVIAPSRSLEGWGRIATEAHASGIPVLASANGGLPESVGPGGILVDINAPLEKWENALSTLWDDQLAYDRLVRASISYSRRKEIQPGVLLDKLERILFSKLGGRDYLLSKGPSE